MKFMLLVLKKIGNLCKEFVFFLTEEESIEIV